ncbi:MAG: phage protein Gp36 family protein [Polyangiales bacterium]
MPQYSDASDLARLGLKKLATAGLSAADVDAALIAASEIADGYLRAQYKLPLVSWGADLRRHVAMIAAWDILSARGFNGDAPGNEIFLERYEQAIAWLKDVSRGLVSPNVVDSTPPKRDGAPRVSTATRRGW